MFVSGFQFLRQLEQEIPRGSSEAFAKGVLEKHGYVCREVAQRSVDLLGLHFEKRAYELACEKTDHAVGFGSFVPDTIYFAMSKDGEPEINAKKFD